jgi:hypothetical protein
VSNERSTVSRVVSGASNVSEGGARREREIAAAKGQPAEEGFETALAADMDTLAAHRSGPPRACQRVETRVPSLCSAEVEPESEGRRPAGRSFACRPPCARCADAAAFPPHTHRRA